MALVATLLISYHSFSVHKSQAASRGQFTSLFNIQWNQTDFEENVTYDGVQIATATLQQVTCDVLGVNLDWGNGTTANSVQVAPFPTPPGSYPVMFKPTDYKFSGVTQYPAVLHAFLHQVGVRPGNTPMDFPAKIAIHERIPIDHVSVPRRVVGGKTFDLEVDITSPAPSWLTRINVKWVDPRGLIVPNNQPVNVAANSYKVVLPVQTKATPRNRNVNVTISTLPDNLITRTITITP